MSDITITGINNAELADVLARGTDHGGNPIEPFVTDDDGWTLRCCLQNAAAGDEIAIIAWSPFPWKGPYAEVGPIVVHTRSCEGQPLLDRLPPELDVRPMTLRPYNRAHHIAYDRVHHLPAGGSVTAHIKALLEDQTIEMVHGRNTTGGCFAFQAQRR